MRDHRKATLPIIARESSPSNDKANEKAGAEEYEEKIREMRAKTRTAADGRVSERVRIDAINKLNYLLRQTLLHKALSHIHPQKKN